MSDREAFEKWYMSRGWVETYDPLMKHGHGGYIVLETCEAWKAWQAAQAQAQAGDGELAVGEVFDVLCEGRIVYAEVYDGAVVPHRAKLYTSPQPTQQVNQQLLEASWIIRRLLDEAIDDFYLDTDPDGLVEEARAAIAAAQEVGNE